MPSAQEMAIVQFFIYQNSQEQRYSQFVAWNMDLSVSDWMRNPVTSPCSLHFIWLWRSSEGNSCRCWTACRGYKWWQMTYWLLVREPHRMRQPRITMTTCDVMPIKRHSDKVEEWVCSLQSDICWQRKVCAFTQRNCGHKSTAKVQRCQGCPEIGMLNYILKLCDPQVLRHLTHKKTPTGTVGGA